MSHDQLVAIITAILLKKKGIQRDLDTPDDALIGWAKTANTIVHAAAGFSAPQ